MLKSEIRKISKAERQKLDEQQLNLQSTGLLNQLWASHLLDDINVLHIFLPIKKLKEPNTWLLIEKIWQEKPHIRLAISKTDMASHSLKHYFFDKNTTLQENTWGISEPDETQASICPLDQIDLVLVPLLACDKQGYRVGYGKGFYDRFLAQCPQALKVGCSLAELLPEPITDIAPHDIRLDYCITPTQVFSFAKS